MCLPSKVQEQFPRFATERPDHPDARKCFTDASVDFLDVLAHDAIDGPHSFREDKTHQHRAGNNRDGRQRQAPVQGEQNPYRHRQSNHRNRRRHNRELHQPRRRIHVAGQAREDAAGFHVPQFR